jgi:hypothetical protein
VTGQRWVRWASRTSTYPVIEPAFMISWPSPPMS